jgi:hypothetical protein
MRPPVKVPNSWIPRLSAQVRTRWYSPGWIVLPSSRAASARVLKNGAVIGFVVETTFELEVVGVIAYG